MATRVCVIGCGAAGLAALRHLAARPNTFQGVGFEMSSAVGGTWRYTDNIGFDKNGLPVHTSMYKNLRTNIPKEVMGFPGYPFSSHLPSFCDHKDVLKYLEDYANDYNLHKYIKFDTKVESVTPVTSDNRTAWKVQFSSTNMRDKVETAMFDAVIVCNGHYSVPLIPKLEGMDKFQGKVIHSHDYRTPDDFKDKVIVCLGGAASGQDICLDIAPVAAKITISHDRARIESPLPSNIVQKQGIAKLTPFSVIYKNGEEENLDVLLLCTGYRYKFPFLSEECQLKIVEERITPLYKHIIHTKFHTLSFIGMCKIICPFPQFDNQVRFVLSTLDGTQKLPSTAEMEEDTENDYRKRLSEGLPHRYAHFMGPRQWDYNDELARLAGFDPIPKAIQKLYNEVHRTRVMDLPNYKTKQYRITGEETYEVLNP